MFDEKEIKKITNNMDSDSVDDSDDSEWVEEGMSINKHIYLTQNVVDHLFGNSFKELEYPLVVYRTVGYSASNHTEKNYSGWVSTTKGKPYDEHNTQKYILPIGFPIIDTEIDGISYADKNEIIVRNEDLQKL